MKPPKISLTFVMSVIALTTTGLWGYERFGREARPPRPQDEHAQRDADYGHHFASVDDEFAPEDDVAWNEQDGSFDDYGYGDEYTDNDAYAFADERDAFADRGGKGRGGPPQGRGPASFGGHAKGPQGVGHRPHGGHPAFGGGRGPHRG
ncbi:MAG: hypothetical protein O2955_00425 [Planctomycetota bacterium]|nr:hypothetical protein [Planctomycetota bacterium]MDA1210946.1 hypothetical protein [Planctomycetota bacterium]